MPMVTCLCSWQSHRQLWFAVEFDCPALTPSPSGQSQRTHSTKQAQTQSEPVLFYVVQNEPMRVTTLINLAHTLPLVTALPYTPPRATDCRRRITARLLYYDSPTRERPRLSRYPFSFFFFPFAPDAPSPLGRFRWALPLPLATGALACARAAKMWACFCPWRIPLRSSHAARARVRGAWPSGACVSACEMEVGGDGRNDGGEARSRTKFQPFELCRESARTDR